MRNALRLVLSLVVFSTLLVAAPVFACQQCFTWSTGDDMGSSCSEPQDAGWGWTKCSIQCGRGSGWIVCTCVEEGDGCYYMVVD